MNTPLVSVICLCYNHEKFVREAIDSVTNQSYKNIQIIVVDDFSTDGSRKQIESYLKEHPQIEYLPLDNNYGNCRAFNKGVALARGEFVVDFATDDVFEKNRIERQVDLFLTLEDDYGIVFTDAQYIDEEGNRLHQHFPYLLQNGLLQSIPQGDIYKELLSSYMIAAPTMLVRKRVFDYLGGYDETLAYEDFDFWVRSSRRFKYAYLNEVLTYIRRSRGSLSTALYKPGDRQLESTYRVCVKALELNRTDAENAALAKRVRYEFRHAVLSANQREAQFFYKLLLKLEKPRFIYNLLWLLSRTGVDLSWVRALLHRIRYPEISNGKKS